VEKEQPDIVEVGERAKLGEGRRWGPWLELGGKKVARLNEESEGSDLGRTGGVENGRLKKKGKEIGGEGYLGKKKGSEKARVLLGKGCDHKKYVCLPREWKKGTDTRGHICKTSICWGINAPEERRPTGCQNQNSENLVRVGGSGGGGSILLLNYLESERGRSTDQSRFCAVHCGGVE